MEREGERDREKENKKTNLKKNGKENEIERDVADHTPRRFVSSRARAWRRCLPCLHGQDFNSIDCQAFDKKTFWFRSSVRSEEHSKDFTSMFSEENTAQCLPQSRQQLTVTAKRSDGLSDAISECAMKTMYGNGFSMLQELGVKTKRLGVARKQLSD